MFTLQLGRCYFRLGYEEVVRSRETGCEELLCERSIALDKNWKRDDLKERRYVASVDIKDEWRGRGFGRALMGKAVEMAVGDQQLIELAAAEMLREFWYLTPWKVLKRNVVRIIV